jgi:hypothetical protein
MQHTGHIGRRDDHGKRFSVIRLRMEIIVFHPMLVPFVLDFGGIVLCGNFFGRIGWSTQVE